MRYSIAILATTTVLVGGAAAAGASYAAVASITEPNANGVVTACYSTSTGAVKMVNSSASCAAGSTKLTWASNTKPKVHVVGAAGEPPYQNGWKRYDGAPFGDASFYKDSSGVVYLTGLACVQDPQNPSICTRATLIGGTLPIFTLPVGYRPALSELLFPVMSVGEGDYVPGARIDITQAGVVEIVAPPDGGEDWGSFDGISFLAS